jgi:exodeoxyribonuclease V alpha subunit
MPTSGAYAAPAETIVGTGPRRADGSVHAWAEQEGFREIMLFLHDHGVSTARAVRIFKS